MYQTNYPSYDPTEEDLEAQKRVKKIKKFYKNLTSWAGTSAFLIALNLFTSGTLGWAKYPVFFWGIAILIQVFEILRLQREQKVFEAMRRSRFPQPLQKPMETRTLTGSTQEPVEDYSGDLLQQEPPEREPADLSEIRRLKRPWKDEDLV